MLREWLNANMPQIVEKALRAELSSASKRPGADDTR
jgi:cell pole-organizing protein PopZ